ncbi:response regulator transcription factor [Mucilaginibacter robiniae]|uniref:Response regulator transcription factor n=1 Tax=Mucilaginibacter robiniae TaxID=2728022 RepID=A0A7L5E1S3_9SPHI|nr:LytTR family DNA-binding domain-containing protein [Mucilaginibacter robiniae]QJD96259.1 response regulator transcription factor [Mucilaginibacter robiniae]
MNTYSCIIIDDESFAIDWLTGYVNNLPTLTLKKAYLNPLDALADLSGNQKVDLILMDIKMPYISGIELSQQLRGKTQKLIFTTAYKKFAYEAYEANVDAYLLKPYSFSKFAATVMKLFPNSSTHSPGQLMDVEDFVLVKNSNDNLKLVKIRIVDIVAVESKQNYVLIHTTAGNVLTHMSLNEISKSLKPYAGFGQFQRSFIIGKRHIDYIYGNTIKMSNSLQVTVGDYYRKEFAQFLAEKILRTGNK